MYLREVNKLKTKLYKSTFIRRLTLSEAETLETILNGQEAYLRLLYNSVEWFDMSDGFVTYLDMALSEAFGEERASELLEAEE